MSVLLSFYVYGQCIMLPQLKQQIWLSQTDRASAAHTIRRGHQSCSNSVTLKSGLEVKVIQTGTIRKWSTVSYSHFVVTMVVSLAICEISLVEEWCDLQNWVRGRSRSLKMAPFDRPCTAFYWSVIVSTALSCTIFELFGIE